MLRDVSPFSAFVDTTFLIIVGISFLVLLGVLTAIVTFAVRYSRKRNPNPSQIEGNVPLEITWTVIPLVLFMGMFYLGWKGYLEEATVPKEAVPIRVTGRMWSWSFEYPNGVQTDTLYVPVNTPIKLLLYSADVNHSFYIPDFRLKKDVIPNRENVLWFKTPTVASHNVACAEYCGLRHSYMYTKIVSEDSASFDAWYRETSQKQSKPYTPFHLNAQ